MHPKILKSLCRNDCHQGLGASACVDSTNFWILSVHNENNNPLLYAIKSITLLYDNKQGKTPSSLKLK